MARLRGKTTRQGGATAPPKNRVTGRDIALKEEVSDTEMTPESPSPRPRKRTRTAQKSPSPRRKQSRVTVVPSTLSKAGSSKTPQKRAGNSDVVIEDPSTYQIDKMATDKVISDLVGDVILRVSLRCSGPEFNSRFYIGNPNFTEADLRTTEAAFRVKWGGKEPGKDGIRHPKTRASVIRVQPTTPHYSEVWKLFAASRKRYEKLLGRFDIHDGGSVVSIAPPAPTAQAARPTSAAPPIPTAAGSTTAGSTTAGSSAQCVTVVSAPGVMARPRKKSSTVRGGGSRVVGSGPRPSVTPLASLPAFLEEQIASQMAISGTTMTFDDDTDIDDAISVLAEPVEDSGETLTWAPASLGRVRDTQLNSDDRKLKPYQTLHLNSAGYDGSSIINLGPGRVAALAWSPLIGAREEHKPKAKMDPVDEGSHYLAITTHDGDHTSHIEGENCNQPGTIHLCSSTVQRRLAASPNVTAKVCAILRTRVCVVQLEFIPLAIPPALADKCSCFLAALHSDGTFAIYPVPRVNTDAPDRSLESYDLKPVVELSYQDVRLQSFDVCLHGNQIFLLFGAMKSLALVVNLHQKDTHTHPRVYYISTSGHTVAPKAKWVSRVTLPGRGARRDDKPMFVTASTDGCLRYWEIGNQFAPVQVSNFNINAHPDLLTSSPYETRSVLASCGRKGIFDPRGQGQNKNATTRPMLQYDRLPAPLGGYSSVSFLCPFTVVASSPSGLVFTSDLRPGEKKSVRNAKTLPARLVHAGMLLRSTTNKRHRGIVLNQTQNDVGKNERDLYNPPTSASTLYPDKDGVPQPDHEISDLEVWTISVLGVDNMYRVIAIGCSEGIVRLSISPSPLRTPPSCLL